jgi:hypothetical protein
MAATVRFDARGFRTFEQRMGGAVARAINKSAVSVRAVGARAISKDMGLRVGDVREQIVLRRAHPTEPTATLTVRGRGIPLIKLGARGREPSRGIPGGVTYRLFGGQRRIARAFIATMESGHRGVFRRRGKPRLMKKGRWAATKRLRQRIVEIVGPSLPRMFTRHAEAMRARYAEVMPGNLRHELQRLVK